MKENLDRNLAHKNQIFLWLCYSDTSDSGSHRQIQSSRTVYPTAQKIITEFWLLMAVQTEKVSLGE